MVLRVTCQHRIPARDDRRVEDGAAVAAQWVRRVRRGDGLVAVEHRAVLDREVPELKMPPPLPPAATAPPLARLSLTVDPSSECGAVLGNVETAAVDARCCR